VTAPAPAPDATALAQWVGREERADDEVGATPIAAWHALLDREPVRPPPGTPIPLLAHWFYAPSLHRQSTLGTDGHAARGGFLPPVPLPRRMWAASRFIFHAPVRIGERIERRSSILSITPKTGRSGALVFVRVGHRLRAGGTLAIEEEHDIVYRDHPAAPGAHTPSSSGPAAGATPPRSPATPAVADATAAHWRERVMPDPVMLFRYSALTSNSHRIHYDRPYAIEEEGYDGLVVHGPLQATLLMALAAKSVGPVARFDYRAMNPALDLDPLAVCGRRTAEGAEFWTEQLGRRSMAATVVLGSAG
jgi:3-methylfumaryl-CoA hydratase